MNHKKRAFTFTEIIVATLLIAVSAIMALTLYSVAYDTNRTTNDTCFLEIVQTSTLEELQKKIDSGEVIPSTMEKDIEAGRFTIHSDMFIDLYRSITGKNYYLVRLTSHIGGSNKRNLTTRVILTQQTGGLYEDYS